MLLIEMAENGRPSLVRRGSCEIGKMSIEPYRTGHAGRPVRAITMEDRLRRYRVMEKASQYADEAIQKHVDAMRNVPGDISNELQLKARAALIALTGALTKM
jgi:hypothetical protein